jgi:transcriptional regulator with XRE-family HTH domain
LEKLMVRSSAVGDYLRARRAVLAPEDVGFFSHSSRKVSGLRREEVAVLAGISPEYYLRLEQGRDHQPSDQVIACLARALRLGEYGEQYLRRLVRPFAGPAGRHEPAVGPAHFDAILAHWRDVPAFIADANLDVVANNGAVEQLSGDFVRGTNLVTAMFQRADERDWTPDWERRAREVVGVFRMSGHPEDRRYQEIVGDLSLRSQEFRRIWRRHDVHVFEEGDVQVGVAPFGSVKFGWRNLSVEGLPGHALTTFFARPGTSAGPVLAYLSARALEARRSAPAAGPAADHPASYSTTTTSS